MGSRICLRKVHHMMKRMVVTKKLAALALASATLLGTGAIAGSAFAADAAPATGNITITSENPNLQPVLMYRTLKAYKIGSFDAGSLVKTDDGKIKSFGLTASIDDDAIKTALKAATGKDWDALHVGADANSTPIQYVADHFQGTGADAYGNKLANSAEMRAFADSLVAQGVLKDGVKVPINTDGIGTLNVPDDQEGIYLFRDESPLPPSDDPHSVLAECETRSLAMIVSSPIKDGNTYLTETESGYTFGSIFLKADRVTISKTVNDNSLVGLDSKRSFTITTNVPTDYQYYTKDVSYVITDNPSDNVNGTDASDNVTGADNLKVVAKGAGAADQDGNPTDATLVAGTDYDVADKADSDDPNDFTVTLKSDKAKELAGRIIVVTYDATVSDLAPTTDNQVQVDFTNDSYADGTGHVGTKVDLHEADLDLTKVAMGDANTTLKGAEFTVTKDGQAVSWEKNGDAYKESGRAGSGRVPVVTSGENGKLTLQGLAANSKTAVTYHFKETKAPTGYRLGDGVEFDVTLTPTFDENGNLTDVKYALASANNRQFDQFLDMTGWLNRDAYGNLTRGTTTYTNAMTVENTENPHGFAPTGAALLAYLAATIACAALGGTVMAVSKRRMNRA